MKLWTAITESVGIFIVGVVVTLLGGLLMIYSSSKSVPDQTLNAFAGMLLTLGGMVASAGVAQRLAQNSAVEGTRQKLVSIGNDVAGIAAQLRQATDDCESGREEPATALYLITKLTERLFQLVFDLEQATGQKLDLQGILDTMQNVIKFASPSVISGADSGSAEQLKAELTMLQSQLESLSKAAGSTPFSSAKSEVEVACPYCSTLTVVNIGGYPGDSAVATCRICDSKFHVHRGVDRAAFAKKWGSPGPSTVEVIQQCPTCSRSVAFRFNRADRGIQRRFCLDCHIEMLYDPEERQLASYREVTPLVGEVTDLEASRSTLECPKCRVFFNSFFKRELTQTHYGVCPGCQQLVVGHEQQAALDFPGVTFRGK